MKIMDISSEDGDCQTEEVNTSASKKSKQARLPFKTLSSDSPVANKKRKPASSPDVRKPKVAKLAKVNTKENSIKKSNKTDIEEITIEDEIEKDEKEEKKADDEKDSSEKAGETPEKKKKKGTPGRTPKAKKESKVQSSPLTMFFKKIDNKDKVQNNESQKPASKNEESKKENGVNSSNDKTEKSSEKSNDQNDRKKEEINKDTGKNSKDSAAKEDQKDSKSKEKKNESCDEEESKDSLSSKEDKNALSDSSDAEDDEKMDVDSDDNTDDSTSDTDKRTEHEDTDSKDDFNKNANSKATPLKERLDSTKLRKVKLTPKQIERKLESQKKREMREKQRLEREKKLQEERENRKKEKEEKKREREEKEKSLKEQKKKEKEAKEQKRLAELEQKQKEKEAKEEDRRKREEARDEEKKKKEEEKLEAERKKQKAASHFVNFFVSKKPTETKPAEKEVEVAKSNFMPFEVKADMRIAPVARRNLSDEEKSKLDKLMQEGAKKKSELYIKALKNKKYTARKSEKTWPFEANDDITIIEDEEEASVNVVQASNTAVEKYRAKLLLFNENRRPPYWGTWRKKSKSINPRRPFALDTKWFDYEVDSDDEWEEEEPGESLRGSDDEKEEDPEDNEYDVDNDFMVPHGYLSDEEIMADEEEGEEEDDLNPEKQKTKLKILNEQFEAERKQKTTKLQPKIIGCFWLKADNTYPENTPAYGVRFLSARQAWVRQVPLSLTPPAVDESNGDNQASSNKQLNARKAEIVEEAVPDLIRLLHGNMNSVQFLAKEFLVFWDKCKEDKRPLPKIRLRNRIRELASYIACPEPGPLQDRFLWYVSEETRKKYLGDEPLSLPNGWNYNLVPKNKKQYKFEDNSEKSEKSEEKKNLPRITQFTKTLTAEEMQKQLAEKPATPPVSKPGEKSQTSTPVIKATPVSARQPKRVALISVPRGEPLPKSPRVSLIDIFVKKESPNVKKTEKKPQLDVDDDDDDDIEIIDDSDEGNVVSVKLESEDMKNNASMDKSLAKDDKNGTVQNDEINNKSVESSGCSDVEILEV